MKNFTLYIFLLSFSFGWSQDLVINELDCDSSISEDLEFIEIKSPTPNEVISNRVLVFFNGSSSGNDSSYFLVDLDGAVTDGNGLLTIGSTSVTPFPQLLISGNTIQNGADAVAIYSGVPDDFPDGTLATIINLVDVLVYDTSDSDDEGLLNIFREDPRFSDLQQINEGSGNNSNSIQRDTDGSYFVGSPSPRQTNDGSGIIFNAIEISTLATEYNEGESFSITFTADQNVTSDLNFDISLSNGTFTTGDYSGSISITIPSGQNTASTNIELLDDISDEGDEELEIEFLNLVEPIIASNNFFKVRVVDNDFTIAAWGTPFMPSYDQVTSTQPAGYYSSLNGKSGQDLRDAVQDIIADPTMVRTHSYADIFNVLKMADQNPENPNQVWLVYSEEGRSKLDQQNSGSSSGKWNREHTFPRSRGDFSDWDDFDDIATGINTFITTNADSTRHANSDAHALRAADAGENSRRSNRHYSNDFVTTSGIGQYNGPANVDPANGIGISFRGDVARGVLFLELRYNGLQIVNGFPTSSGDTYDGQLGDLATLLQWHQDDIPDDYEMNRNNIVYEWQRNRNPLIDLPDLVDYIWGDKVGMVYNGALSSDNSELNRFTFYPNPADNILIFEGLTSSTKIEVLSLDGRKIKTINPDSSNSVAINLSSGLYIIKFMDGNQIETKRLVIK